MPELVALVSTTDARLKQGQAEDIGVTTIGSGFWRAYFASLRCESCDFGGFGTV